MIKNIIFDIGNVLAEFCWEEFYRSFGFSEEVLGKLAKATTMNEDWNELDRGVLSEEEVIALFIENDPSIEKEIRMVCENFRGILKRCDYAIDWINQLKADGYMVFYLSNFFDKAFRECVETLDFFPYLDGGIMSHTVKLTKPEHPIYELLLSRYGLTAQECVFIDDRLDNVNAAKELGIHGIQFLNITQAKADLEKLLAQR